MKKNTFLIPILITYLLLTFSCKKAPETTSEDGRLFDPDYRETMWAINDAPLYKSAGPGEEKTGRRLVPEKKLEVLDEIIVDTGGTKSRWFKVKGEKHTGWVDGRSITARSPDNYNNPLKEALEFKNTNKIYFYSKDVNLLENDSDYYSSVPLVIAAAAGYYDGVEIILGQDLNAGQGSPVKEQALFAAIQVKKPDKKLVKRLFAEQISPDARDSWGRTLLIRAIELDDMELAAFFIEQKADLNLADSYGSTPLIMAVKNKNPRAVKLLLEKGADINRKGSDGKTAFDQAVYNSATPEEIILTFLKNGINETKYVKTFSSSANTYSLLHYAARQNFYDLTVLLLEKGMGPNLIEKDKKTTPLFYIKDTQTGFKIASLLLEKGADPQVRDKYGDTPLFYAARGNNRALTAALIKQKTDLTITDKKKRTPLDIAVYYGSGKVYRLLKGEESWEEAEKKLKPYIPHWKAAELEKAALFPDKEGDTKNNIKRYFVTARNGLELREKKSRKKTAVIPYGTEVELLEKLPGFSSIDGIVSAWTRIKVTGTKKEGLVFSHLINDSKPKRLIEESLPGEWDNTETHEHWSLKKNSDFVSSRNNNSGNNIKSDDKDDKKDIKGKWEFDRENRVLFIYRDGGKGKGPQEKTAYLYEKESSPGLDNDTIIRLVLYDIQKGGKIILERSASVIGEAAGDKDPGFIRELLKQGYAIDRAGAYNTRPIHFAVIAGNYETAGYILDANRYSRGTGTSYGCTPLHFAVFYEQQKIVEKLLEYDYWLNINSKDAMGNTPLHYAVKKGDNKAAVLLIEAGAKLTYYNNEGHTPLHLALLYNRPELVETLLSYGASPDGVNNKTGNTVLHLIFAGIMEKKRKDEEKEDPDGNKKWLPPGLITEPEVLSESDREKLFTYFLEKGVNPALANKESATVLHYAAAGGSPELITGLLEKIDFKIDKTDKKRQTPLFYAALGDNKRAAELLISKGADVNAQGEYSTPLYSALDNSSDQTAKLLLEKGADPNGLTYRKQPLLSRAVTEKKYMLIKELAAAGANINLQDTRDGYTALHIACKEKDLQSITLLLELGADLTIQDKKGATPVHWAARTRDTVFLALLIEKGAAIDQRDSLGNTLLHAAAASGNKEGVQWLLEKGADKEQLNNDGQTVLEYVKKKYSSNYSSDYRRSLEGVLKIFNTDAHE